MSYEPAPEPTDKSDVLDEWADGFDKYRIVSLHGGGAVRVDICLGSDGWYVLPNDLVVDILVERIQHLRRAGKNLVRALEVFK